MVYLTALPPDLSRKDQVRLESLCGWGLLEQALNQRGIAVSGPLKATASRGPYGKPYLPGCGWEFSIAHSRGLAACAVEKAPVGLDLERVREFSSSLAARICGPGEQSLAVGNEPLTQLWTCKESHMKYTGRGFSQGVAETRFRVLGPQPELAPENPATAYFSSISLEYGGQRFWLTECCRGPFLLEVEWVDFEALHLP